MARAAWLWAALVLALPGALPAGGPIGLTGSETSVGCVDVAFAPQSPTPPEVELRVWNDDRATSRYRGSLPYRQCGLSAHSQLVASADGYARTVHRIGSQSTLWLRFSEGVTLRGEVVDQNDHPLSAEVRIVDPSGGPPWTVSAPRGSFEVSGLPDVLTPFTVEARAEGFPPLIRRAVQLSESPIRLVMDAVGNVAGEVFGPHGDPAHGAIVTLAGSGVWPARRLQTDRSGRFRFVGVPSGVYEVSARARDLIAAPRRGLSLDAGQNRFVRFHLATGEALGGRVIDARTDDPVRDAIATLVSNGLSANPQTESVSDEGRFRFHGLAMDETYELSIVAPDYESIRTTVEPGSEGNYRMRPGAVLAGRVVNADGEPVAGATLEILGEDAEGQPIALNALSALSAPILSSRLQPGLAAPPPATQRLEVTEGAVPPIPVGSYSLETPIVPLPPALQALAAPGGEYRSGADGDFEIRGVAAGWVQIVASASGFGPAATQRILLAPGAERRDIVLQMAAAGTLEGEVVDDREFPQPGVLIELRSDSEPMARMTTSDADGHFAFAEVYGELTVTAFVEGEAHARSRAHVESGASARVTLILGQRTYRLAARTVDERGFPLPDRVVTVRSLRPDDPFEQSVVSGSDGTLELASLPPPPWRLTAAGDAERAGRQVDVPDAASEVQLVLAPGARLEGQVRDTNAEGVSCRLLLVSDAFPAEVLTGRSDSSGRFAFDAVRSGAWTLAVEPPIHRPTDVQVTVADPPEPQTLPTVEVELGGRLEGTVIDAFGTPVVHATVQAQGDAVARTQTDLSGNFVLERVGAGWAIPVVNHPAIGTLEGDRVRVLEGRETPGIVLRFRERFDPDQAPARAGRTRGVAMSVRADGTGVIVERVIAGSAAARIGFRTGDRLVSIDGESPTDVRAAERLLRGPLSMPAVIVAQRDGQPATVVVTREDYYP